MTPRRPRIFRSFTSPRDTNFLRRVGAHAHRRRDLVHRPVLEIPHPQRRAFPAPSRDIASSRAAATPKSPSLRWLAHFRSGHRCLPLVMGSTRLLFDRVLRTQAGRREQPGRQKFGDTDGARLASTRNAAWATSSAIPDRPPAGVPRHTPDCYIAARSPRTPRPTCGERIPQATPHHWTSFQ